MTMRIVRLGLGAVAMSTGLLLVDGPATMAAIGQARPTSTPIEHFIMLMQENHSFDNYFGTYPGADGIPEGTCMPIDPREQDGACIEPFWMGEQPALDLSHSQATFAGQLRRGRMDGFISALRNHGNPFDSVMGYYDSRDIPFYWNVADEYVLFDRFFSSAGGGSVWNHFYWVTGTPGNPRSDSLPVAGFDRLPTIFDRLDDAGVSWKFYIQNYDPQITYRTFRRPGLGSKASQVVWVPLLNYARYLDDPRLSSRIVDLSQYYEDLQNGTLPAVAYIVPSGTSEHPPGSIRSGERFVRTLLFQLMRSDAWSSSAFLWTYDDWGGWFDHVAPPQVDRFGYGFRVPALLVSPYAKRGHVDHTTLDYTSALRFIEENWGLEPLARRDTQAESIGSAFDFSQPPRAARFLATAYGDHPTVSRDAGKPRGAIFLTYGVSIVGAILLIVLGASKGVRGVPP